ncbi:hypothetical protein FQZ97_885710 [compost metagenome]
MQGDAEHRRVAALPGGVQVHRIGGLEHEAEVHRRVLLLVVVLRLVLVVVAFVFQLHRQAIPRRLPEHAAEQGRGAAEVGAAVEVTSVGDVAVRYGTIVELVVDPPQRVVQIATITEITPGDAQAQVEIAEALVADEVFAGEQAGTAEVVRADRNFRQVVAFLEQPQLGVERLVLVALVATEFFRAVAAVADRGVAEGGFQPVERLQREAVARVGIGAVGVDADLAGRRHARGRGLQQADAAEIVLRVARVRMRHGVGQQDAECVAESHRATSDSGWVARNSASSWFRSGVGLSGPAALSGTRMIAPGAGGAMSSWRFHRAMPRRLTWPSGWIR